MLIAYASMKEALYLEAAAATNDQQENKPKHYRRMRLFTTIVRKVTVAAPKLLTMYLVLR